jgi:hypothetical protein
MTSSIEDLDMTEQELKDLMLSRQSALISRDVDPSVLFIGCGGIGSNAVHMAVSMGIDKISVIDPDEVAVENIHPGYFAIEDVGEPKAFAISNDSMFRQNTDTMNTQHCLYGDAELGVHDIVVISTDNVPSRRAAWAERDLTCARDGIWIDARMGGYLATVISVDLSSEVAVKTYDEFINTEEAGALPCGEKATAPLTKGFIAGMIGQSFERAMNGKPQIYMQRYDLGMALHFCVKTEKLS